MAASILAVLLVGIYFVSDTGTATGPAVHYLLQAAIVAVAFWFPSQRIGAPRDLFARWGSTLVWLLAWTLVWDLATSGLVGERELFDHWWVVYPAGVLALGVLLLIHALVVRRVGAGTGPDDERGRSGEDPRRGGA